MEQADGGMDLVEVMAHGKVVLSGGVGEFKASRGIGTLLGVRCLINDGNTLVYHFWDSGFDYVLHQEIRY